jgi:hypothetical protein
MKVTPDGVQIDDIDDRDRAAVLASHEVDAPADREWFRQNPGKDHRVRRCSPLEIAAGNHPDAEVHVFRFPDGLQARVITKVDG